MSFARAVCVVAKYGERISPAEGGADDLDQISGSPRAFAVAAAAAVSPPPKALDDEDIVATNCSTMRTR
jgi:hypothetical protein